jgi:UDP-3-O-[3-hydroxymyristoyl] glucosamine N-acyltransferase
MLGNHSSDLRIAPDVRLTYGVALRGFVNEYGCENGDGTRVGCLVVIQKNAMIGAHCKISSHSFISEGVTPHATVSGNPVWLPMNWKGVRA